MQLNFRLLLLLLSILFSWRAANFVASRIVLLLKVTLRSKVRSIVQLAGLVVLAALLQLLSLIANGDAVVLAYHNLVIAQLLHG